MTQEFKEFNERKFKKEPPFKIHAGCGLTGISNESGKRISGNDIICSMACQHDRGNGLGGGFAGYGIYPEYPEHFAFHIMFERLEDKELVEHFLNENYVIDMEEKMPTRPHKGIADPPILWRYFVKPLENRLENSDETDEDFVVRTVMWINSSVEGTFVLSSGKNMGAFKAVGFPEDVGEFYRLDEYKAHTWIGHSRFPTNTPGWWGGAHPFTILDWAIVHNGEISSYGINTRYLEMFGYKCTLRTDTEVMAYLFDLLLRKHGLPIELACKALASPFWKDIDRLPDEERKLMTAIRMVYGSALVNGPFAVVLGHSKGMIGLNDRIKLRPLVAARKGDTVYLSSEDSAIREICPKPDVVWSPKAGEPVIVEVKDTGKKGSKAEKFEAGA
jgi:glutamate synthase domain-containing protein 1